MRCETGVNKVDIGKIFLAKENRVSSTPTKACDTDFEVRVLGAEDGEERFYDWGCDGGAVPEEEWSCAVDGV